MTDKLDRVLPIHYNFTLPFLTSGTSSFTEFATSVAPQVLPVPTNSELAPHGTTIVAATFDHGVVMAGDRRATMGSWIAQRDIEKVFGADEFSVIGIAGVAGLAVELVRLFKVELEHYEKVEGTALSLQGKANRLSSMIRGNLGLAMQGLTIVPTFAGWDVADNVARIYSYDTTGGRYEEQGYHTVGSGAPFARGSLKKTWRSGLDERAVAMCLVQALFDAADEDSATAGPDAARASFPVVYSVTANGVRRFDNNEVATLTDEVVIV